MRHVWGKEGKRKTRQNEALEQKVSEQTEARCSFVPRAAPFPQIGTADGLEGDGTGAGSKHLKILIQEVPVEPVISLIFWKMPKMPGAGLRGHWPQGQRFQVISISCVASWDFFS
jgi:hypothetical protein